MLTPLKRPFKNHIEFEYFSRYTEYGYKDNFEFFYGRSTHNSSIFGWNGHTENGSILSSIEGKYLSNQIS